MPALLGLILPALIPVLAPVVGDAFRSIIGWITGEATAAPKTVDEAIKLMEAENTRLKALAELDKPSENISRWVADLRASFRYIAAGIIILAALPICGYALYVSTTTAIDFANGYLLGLVGPVFSFMFGSRLTLTLRRK